MRLKFWIIKLNQLIQTLGVFALKILSFYFQKKNFFLIFLNFFLSLLININLIDN